MQRLHVVEAPHDRCFLFRTWKRGDLLAEPHYGPSLCLSLLCCLSMQRMGDLTNIAYSLGFVATVLWIHSEALRPYCMPMSPTLERWENFNVTTVPYGVVVGSVFESISVVLERSYYVTVGRWEWRGFRVYCSGSLADKMTA